MESDSGGLAVLVGPSYRRPTAYPMEFLSRLSAAWRGPALVEDLLVSEEPGRLGARLGMLLQQLPREARLLHGGAAAGAATVALARLGFSRIDSFDSNPVYRPLRAERLRHAGVEGRARCPADLPSEEGYDAALLIGDPACRPSPPREKEILAIGAAVRRGGRLFFAAWRGEQPDILLERGWSRSGSVALRPIARQRCRRPRGEASTRLQRRAAGALLDPVALLAPAAVLRVFGECYEIWSKP
ncbi:MAG: hypothetical protein QUU85_05445 [Candidatus Eisenbacteria bacterium]|nr:hypothetical protein [Candidatus Eisenbacteria bacterium]